MPFIDEPAERRVTSYKCDVCGVRETRYYDHVSYSSRGHDRPEVRFEHDWTRLSFGIEEEAFCSEPCLTKRLDGIKAAKYSGVSVT